LETLAVQNRGQPAMAMRLNDIMKNKLYVDKLFSLLPPDSNTAQALPVVMEYKPDLKYFVIKDISVKRIWKEQYEQMKTTNIFRQEHAQLQSLAAVHFNPANVLKRVNFTLIETRRETADANEPGQSAATERQHDESEAGS
jgi:hypothetical protein